jgi:Lysozyme like domain
VKLTDKQIAGAASSAGFAGSDLAIAVAVALAESGGESTATNHNNNGSTDYGLWQINSIHSQILASGKWDDPTSNAKMAYRVFTDAGKRWRPWVTYNTQRYRVFMGRAQIAAGAPGLAPGGGGSSTPAVDIPDLGGLLRTIQFLTDYRNWQRVGMFLAGLVLSIFGLWGILKDTPTGEAIKYAGGKVGDAAKFAVGVAIPP